MSQRIKPVESIDANLLERAELTVGGPIRSEANVYRTLATYPQLLLAWLTWGSHVLRSNSLDAQLRELVILRTTLVCDGQYPLTQHVRIAHECGVTDEEIAKFSGDPTSALQGNKSHRTVMLSVDQLLHRGHIDDRRWNELTESLGVEAVFDLVSTVAFYRLASWMLNTCQTALDPEQTIPDLPSVKVSRVFEGTAPDSQRVPPIPVERWSNQLQDETASWPRFTGRPDLRNARVYGTLANHETLFTAIGPAMGHLLVGNALDDSLREIVIVRSCLHDRGAYPFRQHVRIAAESGVDRPTIMELASKNPSFRSADEQVVVKAVDELHRESSVTDNTWDELVHRLSTDAIMDMVFTAGFYGLISFVLNVSGTQLEPGTVELAPRPFDK